MTLESDLAQLVRARPAVPNLLSAIEYRLTYSDQAVANGDMEERVQTFKEDILPALQEMVGAGFCTNAPADCEVTIKATGPRTVKIGLGGTDILPALIATMTRLIGRMHHLTFGPELLDLGATPIVIRDTLDAIDLAVMPAAQGLPEVDIQSVLGLDALRVDGPLPEALRGYAVDDDGLLQPAEYVFPGRTMPDAAFEDAFISIYMSGAFQPIRGYPDLPDAEPELWEHSADGRPGLHLNIGPVEPVLLVALSHCFSR